jgi:predicted transposase YbfD/YdcC
MQLLLPLHVVAVDGKAIWVGSHAANPYCQAQEQDGEPRYVMRVLRAVWVSGPCKLTIGQAPIPAAQNDMSAFPAFFEQLLGDYGQTEMLQVLSVDAGFASKANADLIAGAQRGYVIALKSPQAELYREAVRLLGRRRNFDAETPWEHVQGKRIRRRLFRTTEMAGWNDWTHLREVWRVRQETEDHGQLSVEERYFLTNLVPGSTAGAIPLHIVRAHWGIENNSNWTLDMAWGEDDQPWTSAALQVVSLMRLLAYNVVTRLRSRRLRSEENRQRPWSNLHDLIEDVLVAAGLRWMVELATEAEGVAALA